MCPLCSGRGFVLAAPVEDGDTLGHPNVRNSYVGTFHEVPCFACPTYSILEVS
jgi:hypothetical protein